MDEEVARLVREERLVEAAELASSRGDSRTASTLFERACHFERAAREALHAKDWARAVPLALEGSPLPSRRRPSARCRRTRRRPNASRSTSSGAATSRGPAACSRRSASA